MNTVVERPNVDTKSTSLESLTANAQALKYRNRAVADRLVREYGLSEEEAEVLFQDTIKFLALTGNGMKISPPARIDLGWHNFILHTRDYAAFCQECFGYFIHHEPLSGLTYEGLMLDAAETATLARRVYGELSANWYGERRATCGSGGY